MYRRIYNEKKSRVCFRSDFTDRSVCVFYDYVEREKINRSESTSLKVSKSIRSDNQLTSNLTPLRRRCVVAPPSEVIERHVEVVSEGDSF